MVLTLKQLNLVHNLCLSFSSLAHKLFIPCSQLVQNCSAWLKLNPKTGLDHHISHGGSIVDHISHGGSTQKFYWAFQLLLTWFWPNLKGRFLGPSLTNANCHGDICLGNICPGDIIPYQQYLSCYWPNFDPTSWTSISV